MSRKPRQRQRVGSQRLAAIQEQLTIREYAIMESVKACRLMTAKHIERLHFYHIPSLYSRSRSCRRALQKLAEAGVLRRRERRVGGIRAGSASYVYALGPAGARLFGDTRPHHYTTEPSDYFSQHTLALAELYVQLYEQGRAGTYPVLEIQTEPPCWRTYTTLEAGMQTLKPDMYVRLGHGDEELSYFIEMDRGTTYNTALLRKIRQYEQYYLAGKEQEKHDVFPQIVWLVPDEKRKEQLIQLYSKANERINDMFEVGLFVAGA